MAEKISGQFIGTALLLTIGVAAGYIYFVHDWYWNHAALICTPDLKLTAQPSDYCYVADPPPEHYETYAGAHSFWGDDIISNFFANIFQLILRWANETIVPSFYDYIAPLWNTYAADENHRKALALRQSLEFFTQRAQPRLFRSRSSGRMRKPSAAVRKPDHCGGLFFARLCANSIGECQTGKHHEPMRK